jgi:hypothetical protein
MSSAFQGLAEPLSQDGLTRVVNLLGVKPAALWALVAVETSGCGFLPDRRPKILFERHVFHKETNGKFDRTAPDLSNSIAGEYGARGANQYERLSRAIDLERVAALRSTSWGLGQVMGFNAMQAGFTDIEAMVAAMVPSEDAHLIAMGQFVKRLGLHIPLQNQEWDKFAESYNGPKYRDSDYGGKLARFFGSFSRGPTPNLLVRSAQIYLMYSGEDPGLIDGVLGQRTKDGLSRAGVPDSNKIDASTLVFLTKKLSPMVEQ